MNLFVNTEDRIKFSVYYGVNKDSVILANHIKEDLIKTDGLITLESDLQEIKLIFRKGSYKDQLDLASSTIRQTIEAGSASISYDPSLVIYLQILQLLVDWEGVNNEDGTKAAPVQKNIDRLLPQIAAAIANGLQYHLNKS